MPGNKVMLQTFKNWKFDVFGYKTVVEDGVTYVNFVWCKICAKNKECIVQHPSIKGASKTIADVFIKGTNFVTKHTVSENYTFSCLSSTFETVKIHVFKKLGFEKFA
jgi:hypothetical protein